MNGQSSNEGCNRKSSKEVFKMWCYSPSVGRFCVICVAAAADDRCYRYADCASCTANTNGCQWCDDKKCISANSNCSMVSPANLSVLSVLFLLLGLVDQQLLVFNTNKLVCQAFEVKMLQKAQLECSKKIYLRVKKVLFRVMLPTVYFLRQMLLSPN